MQTEKVPEQRSNGRRRRRDRPARGCSEARERAKGGMGRGTRRQRGEGKEGPRLAPTGVAANRLASRHQQVVLVGSCRAAGSLTRILKVLLERLIVSHKPSVCIVNQWRRDVQSQLQFIFIIFLVIALVSVYNKMCVLTPNFIYIHLRYLYI